MKLSTKEIKDKLKEWKSTGEISELEIEDTHATYSCYPSYTEGCKYTVYFPKKDSTERIREAILAEDGVKNMIDLDALAEFMYKYIDPNALMVMNNLVLFWDNDRNSSVMKELEERYGENAYELFVENRDSAWSNVWRLTQTVGIDVKRIKDTLEKYGNVEKYFVQNFVDALICESRSLLYACNEFVPRGTPEYPMHGHVPHMIDAYSEKAEKALFEDKEAMSMISAIFKDNHKVMETEIKEETI